MDKIKLNYKPQSFPIYLLDSMYLKFGIESKTVWFCHLWIIIAKQAGF